jgi:hypothetical protein
MARKTARFRISIKDNLTGQALKIELIPWIGADYTVRQNGVIASRVPHANISKVCSRLRHWMALQVKAAYRNH